MANFEVNCAQKSHVIIALRAGKTQPLTLAILYKKDQWN